MESSSLPLKEIHKLVFGVFFPEKGAEECTWT